MYVPASFQVSDVQQLHDFMERHSFAALISEQDGRLTASHLPFLLDRTVPPHGKLIGHMARANRQWEQAVDQSVLVLFQGPHAYISPSWYAAQNVVPTWNYVAVHATGKLRLIEDRQALLEIVQRTVDRYEAARPEPWMMSTAEPEFIERLLAGIVGFEIDLEQIEGKWKLSQNHPLERQEKVIRGLLETGRPLERQIADLMQRNL